MAAAAPVAKLETEHFLIGSRPRVLILPPRPHARLHRPRRSIATRKDFHNALP
mgnify:CR=1 FL=1